jgi:hypothetical protein
VSLDLSGAATTARLIGTLLRGSRFQSSSLSANEARC